MITMHVMIRNNYNTDNNDNNAIFACKSLRHVPRPCIELLRSANLHCVLAIPSCIDKFTDFPTINCVQPDILTVVLLF